MRIETVLPVGSSWLGRRAFVGHFWRQQGQSRHLQTMAERRHNGRVTWFSGSGQHFRRFNQVRQPNGAGIGTRHGTAHKNTHVRYASKAWATKMLMLKWHPQPRLPRSSGKNRLNFPSPNIEVWEQSCNRTAQNR
jgi:hypothetical protein